MKAYLDPGVLYIWVTALLQSHLTGSEVSPEPAVEVVGGVGEGPVLLVLPQLHLHRDGVAVGVDRQAGEGRPQSVGGRGQHPHQGARASSVLRRKHIDKVGAGFYPTDQIPTT